MRDSQRGPLVDIQRAMRVGVAKFPPFLDDENGAPLTVFCPGFYVDCVQCKRESLEDSRRWATTMREYNNSDKKVNDMELDPCMAAEVRLKKKRLGSKNRKILVLLLAALLLLCLTAVIIILLMGRSDRPTAKSDSADYDDVKDPQELRPALARLHPTPETRMFRKPSDNIAPTTPTPDEDEEDYDVDDEASPSPATTQKPTAEGIDWASQLPELDDDNELNLSNPNDAKKALPYVDGEVVRSNCFEYFKDDYLESGVYKLQSSSEESFFAACDMDTGTKGWTIMQRRIDDTTFWNRTFDDYALGFGNPAESYWLGLDRVHDLVASFPGGKALLRIELRDDTCNRARACSGSGSSGYWWGEWKFSIEDRTRLFKLSVSAVLSGNLTSTAFDYFHLMNNNQPFTTVDRDNDRRNARNCAAFRNYGGWWHRDCGFMAPNGKYGFTDGHSKGLYWLYQQKAKSTSGATVTYNINPAVVVMMLRPL